MRVVTAGSLRGLWRLDLSAGCGGCISLRVEAVGSLRVVAVGSLRVAAAGFSTGCGGWISTAGVGSISTVGDWRFAITNFPTVNTNGSLG